MTNNRALEQFISKLNADGERMEAIRRRIITDGRRAALKEYALSLRPQLFDGMAGGRAVIADLFSARQARRLRAEYLAVAREHHIRGNNLAAFAFLSKAALARREEKLRDRFDGSRTPAPSHLQAAE